MKGLKMNMLVFIAAMAAMVMPGDMYDLNYIEDFNQGNDYACPKEHCMRTCSYGYKLDKYGCLTCKCYCKPLQCSLTCPNGFATDNEGCKICNCKEKSCPPLKCPEQCEIGYEHYVDESGCKSCKCKCPKIDCKKNCSTGYQLDGDGCRLCYCKNTDCPNTSSCPNKCKNGYEVDVNGCKSCVCKCEHNRCNLKCPFGLDLDSERCPICKCRKSICQPTKCPAQCENGPEYYIDQHWCIKCKCRCWKLKCNKLCKFGYYVDKDGCQICYCSNKPSSQL